MLGFPDGQRGLGVASSSMGRDRDESRDAAATVMLGGTSYSPELNSIVHEVSTDTFTPAPSHH